MSRKSFKNILAGTVISIFLLPGPVLSQSSTAYHAIDQNRANEIVNMIKTMPEEKVKPIIEPMVPYLMGSEGNLHSKALIFYIISRYNSQYANTAALPVLISWFEDLDYTGMKDEDLSWMYKALSNTGVLLKNFSRLSESQITYLKAIAALRSMKQPDIFGLGSVYLNLATVLNHAGEYHSSLEYLQQASLFFDECILNTSLRQNAFLNKAKLLNNKGLVYQNLFNHEAAIDAFYRSIEIIEQFNISDQDMVYTNLSNSLIELNRFLEARKVLDIVLSKRDTPESGDRIWLLAKINLAQLYQLADKDEIKALRELVSISRLIEGLENMPVDLLIETKLLAGDLLRSTGKYDDALTLSKEIIRLIDSESGDIDLDSAPEEINSLNTLDLINLLLLRSRIYRDLGNKSGQIDQIRLAMTNYVATANLIDSTRGNLQQQSSQIELSRRQESSFDEMISLAYNLYSRTKDRGDLNSLFHFIELSKSAGLWRSMSDSKTKAGILSTEDQALEKKIEIELSDVQGNLTLATDASPKNMKLIKELESRVFQLNIKKDSLIRTYEKKYPDYYRSRFDRSVVSFDQIETAIGKDEAMLQYSMTPDAIICIAVSKKASQVLSFPVDTLTMERINFIINYMKGDYSSYNSSEMKKYYEASTGLYAILIEPFKSIIQNKDLVIIPDGLLNYISFDALIRPTVGGLKHDFHYYDYLIREHIVSYGFTATLYQYRPEHQKKPSRSILAVAPIYKPSNIQLSDFLKTKSDALPHLAGTLKEAKSAWRSAGGKLLIRNSAREGSFKDLCSNYAILHLAMHTLTDRDKPMNSCLVFTPGADNREDGCLFSHEIYNLSLNSSLVVLSACETGSGELAAGEGIMSLGRAFLYAGCSAMVMTLWTVDDQSSEIIMSDFYNNLMKEQALGAAVRNSKLKYLDESDQLKAHPRFWAGILPVGQNTLLVMPTSKSFNYLWFLLLPVSLLGLYFVQKKRNPRQ